MTDEQASATLRLIAATTGIQPVTIQEQKSASGRLLFARLYLGPASGSFCWDSEHREVEKLDPAGARAWWSRCLNEYSFFELR